MAGTVVAVFDDNAEAERAAQALVDDGVPQEDITLVFRGAAGASGTPHDTVSGADTATLATGVREMTEHDVERPVNYADEIAPRAIVGVIIGAPLGSLAVSTAVFFPGVLNAFVGHALAGQFIGAAVGAVLGAAFAVATGGGVPKEAARGYHADVERGRTLVTTLATGRNSAHFQEILRSHGGRKLGYFPRFLDTLQSVES